MEMLASGANSALVVSRSATKVCFPSLSFTTYAKEKVEKDFEGVVSCLSIGGHFCDLPACCLRVAL